MTEMRSDRLRLTSTAEFAGYDRGWTPRDFNNILRLARDVFPEAADWDRGEYRACLRPMTPDGPPVLGPGRQKDRGRSSDSIRRVAGQQLRLPNLSPDLPPNFGRELGVAHAGHECASTM